MSRLSLGLCHCLRVIGCTSSPSSTVLSRIYGRRSINNISVVCHRFIERVGNCTRSRSTFLVGVFVYIPMGGWPICSLADGSHVSLTSSRKNSELIFDILQDNGDTLSNGYPAFVQQTLPSARWCLEALAGMLKFPLRHLYEIDGSKRTSHSNAYFPGLPWVSASFHDDIIWGILSFSEQTYRDVWYSHSTIKACQSWSCARALVLSSSNKIDGYFTTPSLRYSRSLSCIPAFLHAPPFQTAFDFPSSVSKNPPSIVAFLLFQLILVPLEAFVSIGMNAVSRQFEWEADLSALELEDKLGDKEMADMGGKLGRAPIELHVKIMSTGWVDWMYHYSHPTDWEAESPWSLRRGEKEKRRVKFNPRELRRNNTRGEVWKYCLPSLDNI